MELVREPCSRDTHRSGRQHVVEITAAGSSEALKLRKAPVPVPATGEVLIRVAAAGVNRHFVRSFSTPFRYLT
jgi:hypothetical protein